MKEKGKYSPFALHSNIGGKERVSILKEDLDKLTDEDWAELKRRKVHVCIIGLAGDLGRYTFHPTIEELEAQMKESLEKEYSPDTIPDDLIPFT